MRTDLPFTQLEESWCSIGSSVVFLNRLLKKEALNEEKREQPARFKNSFTMISPMGKKKKQSDDFLECFVREKETVL